MDLIYTDKEHNEIGYISNDIQIDFEIGSVLNENSSSNDFQLSCDIDKIPKGLEIGSLIYEVGSEIGGIVNGLGADTSQEMAYIYGITWRGMLAHRIIEPPANEAYKLVSGEANAVISDLIDSEFENLIIGSKEVSDINVNTQFRYTNMLNAIESMIDEKGGKLKIINILGNDGFHVEVGAEDSNDYTNTIQLDNDYDVTFQTKKLENGVNHLICLGSGELTDRQVIHLYRALDGAITTDASLAIKGLNERAETYDYSSVESYEDLLSGGIKRMQELSDTESVEMTVDIEADVGDCVGGKEQITNISVKSKISQKIYKGYVDDINIEIKLGD